MTVLEIIATACMIGGALIFLVGAFGLLRLRDFYARLSGVGIAAGLGTSLLLLGLLLHYPTPANTLKIGLALLVQLSTAAVGGNAMVRAGYLARTEPTDATRFDDLAATSTPADPPSEDRS
mgnify:CR=1 FL=1|jgi:multicomponent Na+:H+ antiporter subunit G